MSNTEEEPLTKGERRAVGVLSAGRTVFLFLLDLVLFIVFAYNVYLILKNDFDLGTVAWGSVAFFYLLADAVNQGLRRAVGALGASATVRVKSDDTPDV